MGSLTFTVDPGGSQDGHVARDNSAVYPPNTTSDPSTGSLIHVERAYHAAVQYIVSVGLVRFDTSAIPDTATVTGATLTLTLHAAAATANRMGETVMLEWYNHGGTIDAADYTATPSGNAYGGLAVAALTPTSQWGKPVSFTLTNPAANVSKTGTTGLRIHISAFTPVPSLDQVAMDFYEAPADLPSRWPQLLVSFTVPPVTNLAGSGTGGGGTTPSTAAPRRSVGWQLYLCDELGAKLERITAIATGRELKQTLNRPSSLTFQVPSDDSRIAATHSDGFPMLHPLRRTVKAYRQEASGNVLRFAGHVWQLGDAGGGEDATTRVTCMDPLQWLHRRTTGLEQAYKTSDGAAIAKHLVDTLNAESSSPVTTTGGTFEVTEERTLTFDRRPVAECLVELANSFAGFDMRLDPLDSTPQADQDHEDDFLDGTLDATYWGTGAGTGITISEAGGELRFTFASAADGTVSTVTGPNVNLQPILSLTTRVSTYANVASASHAIRIAGFGTPNGAMLRVQRLNSTTVRMSAIAVTGGGTETSLATVDIANADYGAGNHRLRIRYDPSSTVAVWEYSTDGTNWTVLHSATIGTVPRRAWFEGRAIGGTSGGGTVGFDIATIDFEAPPIPPLGRLNAFSRLGQFQSGQLLGWDAIPHNIETFERTLDGNIVVNDLIVTGAGDLEARVLSPESIDDLGLLQGRSSLSDITNTAYLNALAQEEANFRLAPRELVEFQLIPGASPEPFTHLQIGDTVPVTIGPRARGGFGGVMRIYGWTITLDDEAKETVALVLAPEAGS